LYCTREAILAQPMWAELGPAPKITKIIKNRKNRKIEK
jgi:hypothetical protein